MVAGLRCLALVTASAVALGLSASTEAHSSGNACPMSHVLYRPYNGVDATGLRTLPWIVSAPPEASRRICSSTDSLPWGREHLLGARIFTTRKAHSVNPKVLWITRARGYRQTLTMRGQRLDAPGSFTDTYQGFGDYPSYVNVPAPGCWRVTVTTGHATGSVVFSATD